MVRYHHGLNGHESEQTPGDSGGQRSLVCCSPWGRRVRDDVATEQGNTTINIPVQPFVWEHIVVYLGYIASPIQWI